MIIKKYTAKTETEAIMLARNELGPEAIVTNIRKFKQPAKTGLFKSLRAVPVVEITVAMDDTPPKNELSRKESMKALFKDRKDIIFDDDKPEKKEEKSIEDSDRTREIEKQLNNISSMIEKNIVNPSSKDNSQELTDTESEKNMSYIKAIYNQLLENEVDEKFINEIINEIEPVLKKEASLENILSNIYQRIVLKLGKTEILDVTPGKVKYVFFIGPTGVGKTTTIAKLASKLKLDMKLNVALLTSDTYRIAAVEQLHTYANILQIPLKVVYNEAELLEARDDFSAFDVVLIDTAGRSHRDKAQCDDAAHLLNCIPKEQREVFLVLSVTTKYKDLLKITEAYSEFSDYKLIFTKLDETDCLGNIFNIKLNTGAALSYSTFGQKVPNDISKLDPQAVAKQLLGGLNKNN